MPSYAEVLELTRSLSLTDRLRLAADLTPGALGGVRHSTPPTAPAPQTAAWLRAEEGHAVLSTGRGPVSADLPAGAPALAGIWADLAEGAEGAA